MDIKDAYEWDNAIWCKPMTEIHEPGKRSIVSVEKGKCIHIIYAQLII
jgi:hypothetical protein